MNLSAFKRSKYFVMMGLVALILGSCHTKTEFSYLKFRRAPFTESINKPGFKKFIFQFLLTDVNQPHPNLLYYAINDSNTIIGHGVLDYLMDSTSKPFPIPRSLATWN